MSTSKWQAFSYVSKRLAWASGGVGTAAAISGNVSIAMIGLAFAGLSIWCLHRFDKHL